MSGVTSYLLRVELVAAEAASGLSPWALPGFGGRRHPVARRGGAGFWFAIDDLVVDLLRLVTPKMSITAAEAIDWVRVDSIC